MIYTDSSRYAVRAMLHLAARRDPERPSPAAAVADEEHIPPFYLAKLLRDLERAGLLESVRGRGGGFRLSRPAEKILLIDIVAAVEDLTRFETACVLGIESCTDDASCPMHSLWRDFSSRALHALGTTTLAELRYTEQHRRLAEP